MRSLTLSVVVLLFSACLVTPGWCLYCWSCPEDGSDDSCSTVQECQQANSQYLTQIRSRFFPNAPPVDYNNPKNVPQPVCYTEISKSTDGDSFSGRRACSPLGAQMTCEVLRSSNQNFINCTICTKDFCNDHPVPVGKQMVKPPSSQNTPRPQGGQPPLPEVTFPTKEETINYVPQEGHVTPPIGTPTNIPSRQVPQKSGSNSTPPVALILMFTSWVLLKLHY